MLNESMGPEQPNLENQEGSENKTEKFKSILNEMKSTLSSLSGFFELLEDTPQLMGRAQVGNAFKSLEKYPIDLEDGENSDQLIALKQELIKQMKDGASTLKVNDKLDEDNLPILHDQIEQLESL